MPNPITDQIRAIRHELVAQFDNDLDRIVADLRRQQRESGRDYIELPRREPRTGASTNQTLARSGRSSGTRRDQTDRSAGAGP